MAQLLANLRNSDRPNLNGRKKVNALMKGDHCLAENGRFRDEAMAGDIHDLSGRDQEAGNSIAVVTNETP
jgi:hypothetical protein